MPPILKKTPQQQRNPYLIRKTLPTGRTMTGKYDNGKSKGQATAESDSKRSAGATGSEVPTKQPDSGDANKGQNGQQNGDDIPPNQDGLQGNNADKGRDIGVESKVMHQNPMATGQVQSNTLTVVDEATAQVSTSLSSPIPQPPGMVDVHSQWTGGPHMDMGAQQLPYQQQMWPPPADNQHNMYTLSAPNVTQQAMATVSSIGQA